jgi:AcrR family transcriptional regulator
MRPKLELSPKKRPTTARGAETYGALVTATARLLERSGYEALTTNHVADRAGVGVASVYEFFPSKHALVAAVVEDTVDMVIAELGEGLEHALRHGRDPVAEWVGRMFAVIAKRKRLVSVLVQEVPFFWQVPAVKAARARLYALSVRGRALNVRGMPAPHMEAMTYLMPVMVANAVIDAVIRPPSGVSGEALEAALIDAVKRLVG